MRSSVALKALSFAALFSVVSAAGLISQTPSSDSSGAKFRSHVYAWFPNNEIRRLSPGPEASVTSAMPLWGPFGQPHIHPDGTAVVFWGGVTDRPRVWLYEFGIGEARPVTSAHVGSFEPSFDWQGRRIAFAADVIPSEPIATPPAGGSWRRSNSNLFVATTGGANPHQITSGSFQDARPAFSPDGREIVFLSNRDGKGRGLYIVSADGSGEPRRVLPEYGVARPWFSPDGRFIYFTFYGTDVAEEHIRVWRVPAGGGPKEPITPDNLPNSQGTFVDFDSVHLWFHSAPRGAFRFNLQTRELVPMTPPGFSAAWHVSRSRNGIVAFDSDQLDPTARP